MIKQETLRRFILRSNLWSYDYGDGTKSLPLLSRATGDPTGLYTANVPLLSIPLIGDLDHRGEKFKYLETDVDALIQDDEWDLVPLDKRTEVMDALRRSGLGQGGGRFRDLPLAWSPNFGAENARLRISTWGGAGGTASCRVVFRDTGTNMNQMLFCDDSGALYSYVRRNGVTGTFDWDTVRWAGATVNGTTVTSGSFVMEFNTVYDIVLTANGNTGLTNIGDGPSSASNTYLTGSISDIVLDGGNRSSTYKMVIESETAPTGTVIEDTVGSSDGGLTGFGSRPLWALSPV